MYSSINTSKMNVFIFKRNCFNNHQLFKNQQNQILIMKKMKEVAKMLQKQEVIVLLTKLFKYPPNQYHPIY